MLKLKFQGLFNIENHKENKNVMCIIPPIGKRKRD